MSGKDELNRANPSSLDTAFQKMGIGNVMATAVPQFRRNVSPNTAPANPYILATLQGLHADGAGTPPAASLLRATVKTSGVTDGEFTAEPFGTTPATTQFAIAPNGDVVFLGADAVTAVDYSFIPELGEVFDLPSVPVLSTGVCAIPGIAAPTTSSVFANGRSVVLLMEAEILTGAVTGKCIVLAPSDSNPGTTKEANLKLAKGIVLFKASDIGAGGGTARLRLWVSPLLDPAAFMGGADIAP